MDDATLLRQALADWQINGESRDMAALRISGHGGCCVEAIEVSLLAERGGS